MAQEALQNAFDQGWADPRKLSHQSAKARILKAGALESLAGGLHIAPDKLEFIGEPRLGHFYSITGLLQESDLLIHSAIDRSEVLAIARLRSSLELPVDLDGLINPAPLKNAKSGHSVFALQIANGETGVIQRYEDLIDLLPNARIACDFSSAGPHLTLPSRWDTAFFDAKSWQGPEGVGVIAINNAHHWKNPLPHIGPQRVPQSLSLPLLLASAMALEASQADALSDQVRLRELSMFLRKEISSTITDCDIAGKLDHSLPHINSFSFLYVEGEELLRRLDASGFAVDSGSACSADDLAPSHVLAAMGVLTHGNVRITLHPSTTKAEIVALVEEIRRAVLQIRSR